ncbi:discoidin domain-containing protein [Paenibacillus sp. FSL H7-0357]|uniref:discoidin domain-containing protein n=1 Tax=Paenibacillus sp. FSL H7-0357 TaxID=1536774 RepID=UPI00068EF3BC|nr:discoidin domain-containing protein [Paenibacillus sp. FSL H7-0357]
MKKKLGLLFMFFVILFSSFNFSINTSLAEERYSENLIPVMTSSTPQSGSVKSSEQWDGGTSNWKAFDGILHYSTAAGVYTAWGTTKTTGWLSYEFPNPRTISKYVIGYGGFVGTSEFGSQPKNWTFEGSNDGVNWVILDSQNNVTTWVKNTPKSYRFENNTAYKFYRINISANNGSTNNSVNLTIHELQMMEKIIEVPNSPTNLAATAGNAKVDLAWTSVSGATSYTVKRSLVSGGPYISIATNVTDITYVDNTVVNGTTYYYVVAALKADSESANSNEASATPQKITKPDPEPSGDRAILAVTLTNGSEKEYDLSFEEVTAFLNWYDAKDAGTGPAKYAINKHDNNKGPFTSRKDYVIFDKILTFQVSEYTAAE